MSSVNGESTKTGDPEKPSSSSTDVDDQYYESYGELDCHQLMVSDVIRTQTYRFAILKCCDQLFKRTVVDLGCGSGILSVFCAQAGASKVYAIDGSGIASMADKIVAANNLQNKITVIHKAVEQLDDTSVLEKVDAIVSEWMGYTLFSEWMLRSLIHARDRWLNEKGLLFPCQASVFIAPVSETSFFKDKVSLWQETDSIYNVDMSCLAVEERRSLLNKIVVHEICLEEIVALPQQLISIDLYKISTADLECLKGTFSLKCFGSNEVHGFCLYFEVSFPETDIVLSTSPYKETTHWAQSVLYIEHPLRVEQDYVISGSATFRPDEKNHRLLVVSVEYQCSNSDGSVIVPMTSATFSDCPF